MVIMAYLISVLTLILSRNLGMLCGSCDFSVTGLPENIGMETDAFFKSLDYNIRWPDGSDVDRKQAFLNLLNPADKIDFNYANSILGKMQCLPVGYSETLTFWIQGQTSCPTYSVTVTVVPMMPDYFSTSNPWRYVDTCESDTTVYIVGVEYRNDITCGQFDCTVECINFPSHYFWAEGKNLGRRPRFDIFTSFVGINFGSQYNLRMGCYESSITNPTPDIIGVKEVNVTFERMDTCTSTTPLSTTSSTTQAVSTTPTTTTTSTTTSPTTTTPTETPTTTVISTPTTTLTTSPVSVITPTTSTATTTTLTPTTTTTQTTTTTRVATSTTTSTTAPATTMPPTTSTTTTLGSTTTPTSTMTTTPATITTENAPEATTTIRTATSSPRTPTTTPSINTAQITTPITTLTTTTAISPLAPVTTATTPNTITKTHVSTATITTYLEHEGFLDNSVNVGVISAVAGLLILGISLSILLAKYCSGLPKVTPF